jgi:phage tail-like protein
MPDAAKKPTAPSGAQPGNFAEPFRDYNFKLLFIPDVPEGHFTQCSSIGVKVDSISYREGGNAQVVHRLPGNVQYSSVTLRYGLTQSRELWDWMMTAVNGAVQRRTVHIVMLNPQGAEEQLRWTLHDAWPSSWLGAPLDAMSSLVAIESLELVYETLERQ